MKEHHDVCKRLVNGSAGIGDMLRAAVTEFSRGWISKRWIRISGQGALALLDQALASCNNFLTGLIIGRFCLKEEFGLYALCFTMVLFAQNLQSAIISSPYTIYSPRLKGGDLVRYCGSTLVQQLCLSLATILILIIISQVVSTPPGLVGVIWALVPAVTFILLKEYARQILFAHQQLSRAVLIDAFATVIQVVLLFGLARGGMLSARGAFLIIGTASAFVVMFWLYFSRRMFAVSRDALLSDLRRNWTFGKWILAATLVLMGSTELYPWFLAHTNGVAATGALAACLGTIYLANPFVMGMTNLLGPKIAHASVASGATDLRRIVANATFLFGLVMVPFCLVMIFFGGSIVAIIYGGHYEGNGKVIAVLALSQVASTVTVPLNYGLLAMERSDVGFISYLLALIVTLLLGWWLVRSLGLIGVAYGLLAGNIAASTFRFVMFRYHLGSASRIVTGTVDK